MASVTSVVVIVAALTMLVGVIGAVVNRVITKKGIGLRMIQFVTVVVLAPGVLILALLKVIDSQATQLLIGAFVGYILSSLSGKQSARDGNEGPSN